MTRAQLSRMTGHKSLALALLCPLLALPGVASADVKLDGEWPAESPKVSLDATKISRSEALKQLAWWSVVVMGAGDELVDVHIKDQPADKVLAVLLADGSWVAKNDGGIVSITAAPQGAVDQASPPAPPVPEAPPAPTAIKTVKKRNVKVFGDSARIGKDEVVHDVTVMGGSVLIEGRVTGKLAVFGGHAELASSARIDGDVALTGGDIKFEEGAEIGGDLAVMGGSVEGANSVKVGGSTELDPSDGEQQASFFVRAGHSISSGMRTAAFLFIVGALFVALGGVRAESVRTAIAASPMRSIALGLVGLVGSFVALCLIALTIIGIPFATIDGIAAVALAFAGTASAAVVLGAMVAGHKSQNVYVHLAAGCALFMVAGFLPWIGGWVQAAIVFAGIGGMVATRAMGFLERKTKPSFPNPLPYR
jgi:hypothetical protein